MSSSVGNLLIGLGIALVVVGVVAKTGALDWFGRLPGDIRIERGSSRVDVPWVSMLVVSVALSVVVNLVARWFRDR